MALANSSGYILSGDVNSRRKSLVACVSVYLPALAEYLKDEANPEVVYRDNVYYRQVRLIRHLLLKDIMSDYEVCGNMKSDHFDPEASD